MDCLAASELDQVLSLATKCALSAMVFYNYRRGGMTAGEFGRVLRKGVREHGKLFVPLHIRHHWVLLVVREEGNLRGEIYDSAPSYIVQKDITKLLSMVSLEFRVGMRQLRRSNECGGSRAKGGHPDFHEQCSPSTSCGQDGVGGARYGVEGLGSQSA